MRVGGSSASRGGHGSAGPHLLADLHGRRGRYAVIRQVDGCFAESGIGEECKQRQIRRGASERRTFIDRAGESGVGQKAGQLDGEWPGAKALTRTRSMWRVILISAHLVAL